MPFALKAASDFPTGNTQVLEIRHDGTVPEIHFAAVPSGGPEAIWFHFGIEPPRKDAPPVIRCVLPEITIEAPYSHSRETILNRENYQAAGHQIAGAVIEVIASSSALSSDV